MKHEWKLSLLLAVLAVASVATADVYNLRDNWDGDGLQGDAGVWYFQTTAWDQGVNPSSYSDLAWDSANAKYNDGVVGQITSAPFLQSYTSNAYLIVAFQAPQQGTVNFKLDAINWAGGAIVKLIGSDGAELQGAYPGHGSGVVLQASDYALDAGERIYMLYRSNSGGATHLDMRTDWQNSVDIIADFTAVPEPATMSVLGIGGMLALLRRRK